MYNHYKQQLIKFCKSMNSYCLIVDFWSEPFTGKTGLLACQKNLFFLLFPIKDYRIVVLH